MTYSPHIAIRELQIVAKLQGMRRIGSGFSADLRRIGLTSGRPFLFARSATWARRYLSRNAHLNEHEATDHLVLYSN